MQRKAFLYRLYPSRPQERLLDATLETCRHFYNECLSERKTAYEERGDTIGTYEQLRHVKQRKATNPWCKNGSPGVRGVDPSYGVRRSARG